MINLKWYKKKDFFTDDPSEDTESERYYKNFRKAIDWAMKVKKGWGGKQEDIESYLYDTIAEQLSEEIIVRIPSVSYLKKELIHYQDEG